MPYTHAKLRKLRNAVGYSQEFVATTAAISQATYSRYESGSSEPSFGELEKIAALYGFRAGEFLDKESADLLSELVSRPDFLQRLA